MCELEPGNKATPFGNTEDHACFNWYPWTDLFWRSFFTYLPTRVVWPSRCFNSYVKLCLYQLIVLFFVIYKLIFNSISTEASNVFYNNPCFSKKEDGGGSCFAWHSWVFPCRDEKSNSCQFACMNKFTLSTKTRTTHFCPRIVLVICNYAVLKHFYPPAGHNSAFKSACVPYTSTDAIIWDR